MDLEGSARNGRSETTLGTIAFLLAVAAAGLLALSSLVIGFIVLFPEQVPDDAPGLALLLVLGPPTSLALGISAFLLGLWCILLKRRGLYAAAGLLVGASVVALATVLTLQRSEELRIMLQI